MNLRRTELYDRHVALGAKLVDFGGWEMPIEYAGKQGDKAGGVVAEHTAVRESVGAFDVSHMGKVRVHGPGAVEFVNSVVTNDLAKIGSGQAQYSMLCNDAGGVIDDLIIYRWSDDELFIVPNASNAATVVAALRAAAPEGIIVDDHHNDHGIIAVQGPKSAEVMATLGLPHDHEYMHFVGSELHGEPVIVCRTGYTGEHGYELVVPTSVLGNVWDDVIAAGATPAGLGARDTLRTEMGYPLHGQDLSPTISPVQARIGWAVGWDKPAFHGRDALIAEKAAGPARKLWGVRATERAIPRPHMIVHTAHGEGEVTSGTFSPTLKQGIGLALLPAAVSKGDIVELDVRGKRATFEVVAPPFVQPATK